MTRPRLLDLFSGAGGAGEGYRRAGFDVLGVDLDPHDYPPGRFLVADALAVLDELVGTGAVAGFRPDAVHASPPCQAYSDLHHLADRQHPELIEPVRDLLTAWGGPYVIENVEGSPLVGALRLCGSEFGLGATCRDGRRRQLRRHRLFESNVWLMGAGGCHHRGQPVGVYGTSGGGHMNRGYKAHKPEGAEAMGIDWMRWTDLNQAIPPAYTEHVGWQLAAHLAAEAGQPSRNVAPCA